MPSPMNYDVKIVEFTLQDILRGIEDSDDFLLFFDPDGKTRAGSPLALAKYRRTGFKDSQDILGRPYMALTMKYAAHVFDAGEAGKFIKLHHEIWTEKLLYGIHYKVVAEHTITRGGRILKVTITFRRHVDSQNETLGFTVDVSTTFLPVEQYQPNTQRSRLIHHLSMPEKMAA